MNLPATTESSVMAMMANLPGGFDPGADVSGTLTAPPPQTIAQANSGAGQYDNWQNQMPGQSGRVMNLEDYFETENQVVTRDERTGLALVTSETGELWFVGNLYTPVNLNSPLDNPIERMLSRANVFSTPDPVNSNYTVRMTDTPREVLAGAGLPVGEDGSFAIPADAAGGRLLATINYADAAGLQLNQYTFFDMLPGTDFQQSYNEFARPIENSRLGAAVQGIALSLAGAVSARPRPTAVVMGGNYVIPTGRTAPNGGMISTVYAPTQVPGGGVVYNQVGTLSVPPVPGGRPVPRAPAALPPGAGSGGIVSGGSTLPGLPPVSGATPPPVATYSLPITGGRPLNVYIRTYTNDRGETRYYPTYTPPGGTNQVLGPSDAATPEDAARSLADAIDTGQATGFEITYPPTATQINDVLRAPTTDGSYLSDAQVGRLRTVLNRRTEFMTDQETATFLEFFANNPLNVYQQAAVDQATDIATGSMTIGGRSPTGLTADPALARARARDAQGFNRSQDNARQQGATDALVRYPIQINTDFGPVYAIVEGPATNVGKLLSSPSFQRSGAAGMVVPELLDEAGVSVDGLSQRSQSDAENMTRQSLAAPAPQEQPTVADVEPEDTTEDAPPDPELDRTGEEAGAFFDRVDPDKTKTVGELLNEAGAEMAAGRLRPVQLDTNLSLRGILADKFTIFAELSAVIFDFHTHGGGVTCIDCDTTASGAFATVYTGGSYADDNTGASTNSTIERTSLNGNPALGMDFFMFPVPQAIPNIADAPDYYLARVVREDRGEFVDQGAGTIRKRLPNGMLIEIFPSWVQTDHPSGKPMVHYSQMMSGDNVIQGPLMIPLEDLAGIYAQRDEFGVIDREKMQTYSLPSDEAFMGMRGLERDLQTIYQLMHDVSDENKPGLQRLYLGLVSGDPNSEDAFSKFQIALSWLAHYESQPGAVPLGGIGMGETTIAKEGVTNFLRNPIDLSNPDHMDRIISYFEQVGETGAAMIVHADIGPPKAVERYMSNGFDYVLDENGQRIVVDQVMVRQDSPGADLTLDSNVPYIRRVVESTDAPVIWAHFGGIGRTMRPNMRHVAMLRDLLEEAADPTSELTNLYIDMSWDVVTQYFLQDPALAQAAARLVKDHPDRFLYGSDTVGGDGTSHNALVDLYRAGVFDLLTIDELELVLRGNAKEIMTTSSGNVRAYMRENAAELEDIRLNNTILPPDQALETMLERPVPDDGPQSALPVPDAPIPVAGTPTDEAGGIGGPEGPRPGATADNPRTLSELQAGVLKTLEETGTASLEDLQAGVLKTLEESGTDIAALEDRLNVNLGGGDPGSWRDKIKPVDRPDTVATALAGTGIDPARVVGVLDNPTSAAPQTIVLDDQSRVTMGGVRVFSDDTGKATFAFGANDRIDGGGILSVYGDDGRIAQSMPLADAPAELLTQIGFPSDIAGPVATQNPDPAPTDTDTLAALWNALDLAGEPTAAPQFDPPTNPAPIPTTLPSTSLPTGPDLNSLLANLPRRSAPTPLDQSATRDALNNLGLNLPDTPVSPSPPPFEASTAPSLDGLLAGIATPEPAFSLQDLRNSALED